MARKLILENLMKLAQGIGANPSKFMGTKTNISFLGKGPTKNPLFQRPVPGLEEHITSITLQGQRGAALDKPMISAVEDAMGFATANKLNDIQLKALTINLESLYKGLNPPMASVAPIREGIKGIHLDNILNQNPRYKSLLQHKLKNPRMYPTRKESLEMTREEALKKYPPSRLPEPGPEEMAAFSKALDQQTGMSRAIARNLLLKDTRLKLKPEELFMLKEGKGEPLDLMKKYYGESMLNYDDFLNSVNLEAARPDEFAEMILKNVELIPAFAGGGLARILEL